MSAHTMYTLFCCIMRKKYYITFSFYSVASNISKGFPDISVGKESTCNAGDLSVIPGSGGFTGEGIGYPLQNSWPSLVAQLVKNPPAMWETWIRSLGWEDPLEKGKATHFSILALNSMDCVVHGVTKSWTQLSEFHTHITSLNGYYL